MKIDLQEFVSARLQHAAAYIGFASVAKLRYGFQRSWGTNRLQVPASDRLLLRQSNNPLPTVGRQCVHLSQNVDCLRFSSLARFFIEGKPLGYTGGGKWTGSDSLSQ